MQPQSCQGSWRAGRRRGFGVRRSSPLWYFLFLSQKKEEKTKAAETAALQINSWAPALRLDKTINALPRGRIGHEIDFSLLILSEGENRQAAIAARPVGDNAFLLRIVAERPELIRDVVAVHVRPLQVVQALAAVDESARDRLADVVVILPDGVDHVLARAGALASERMQALAAVPAVVAA